MTSFYDEIKDMNKLEKKASSEKDSFEIRQQLEGCGYSSEKLATIAEEVLGIFSKKAAEEVIEGVTDQVVPSGEQAAAETLEDNVVGSDEALAGDAKDAAIAAAESSIADAASAVETLKAVTEVEDTNVPEEGAEAIAPEDQTADNPVLNDDAAQVTASKKSSGIAKKAEEESDEEKKEDKKDSDEEKSEEESEEDEEEKEAMEEFNRIMKEGSAEEKEALIKLAYDQVAIDMAGKGVSLPGYINSQLGGNNQVLAFEIAENAEKLAFLSGKNYFRVADDILVGIMEKSASAN